MPEFDQEAIDDMADVFGEYIHEVSDSSDENQRVDNELMLRLSETCNKHDITEPDDRIDFIIRGLRQCFRREEQKTISDIRETLEMMYRVTGYDI